MKFANRKKNFSTCPCFYPATPTHVVDCIDASKKKGDSSGNSILSYQDSVQTTYLPQLHRNHNGSLKASVYLQDLFQSKLLLAFFVKSLAGTEMRRLGGVVGLSLAFCTYEVAGSSMPKSVKFHDAENRQRPCRMIIRHVKYHWSICLAWLISAKVKPCRGSHHQSSGASLWGGNWTSELSAYMVPH
ncbi:hypothetical protein TNCV_3066511 [Trichonephila clavipes]|nr:hypothetical protein TNCV_3066511 [Trichonephila clavipes]